MAHHHPHRRQRRRAVDQAYVVPDLKALMLSIGRPDALDPEERRTAVYLFGHVSGLQPTTDEEYDFLVEGLERFAAEMDSGVSVEESIRRLMERDGQHRG